MSRFHRDSACIRLRRSVYAFSQKHSLYEKEPKLVDALKLVNFIREINGDVKIISRVVVVNAVAAENLLQETTARVEKGVVDIVSSCKELYMKARTTKEYGVLRERFSRIKRRFLILKKVAAVYAEWLKLDSSKSLMRAYHALRKVDSVLNPA